MAAIRQRHIREPFEIHDEGMEEAEEDERSMREEEDEEEDQTQDDLSECSEDSDAVVDPMVKEDMNRFEDSFRGISTRFRLINRIGEGMYHEPRSMWDLV